MPEIKTTVLVILDGWGVGRKDNTLDPIVPEHAPNYFDFLKKYPNTLLQASGEAVGLFKGRYPLRIVVYDTTNFKKVNK